MAKAREVHWMGCACGSKRGFETAQDAEKALGRSQTRRNRMADKSGPSRRGMEREGRFYECREGMFHLTKQSASTRRSILEELQETYAADIRGVA